MRKISTLIGVSAMLLIASFASIPLAHLSVKTTFQAAVNMQPVATATEDLQTTRQSFQAAKSDNLKNCCSITLQSGMAVHATTAVAHNFYTHSAINPYYINTL